MKTIKARKHKELKPEEIRWTCDPDIFKFASTDEIEPMDGILGQERALKALKLGVDLRSPGYNIYIAGLSGTGKASTVKKMLETISSNCPLLYDYAYVNNFKDPDRPTLLIFPRGQVKNFKKELCDSIEMLKSKIPQSLESKNYQEEKKKIVTDFASQQQKLIQPLQEKLKKNHFTLGQVQDGQIVRPELFPVINNKPVPLLQLENLVQKKQLTQKDAEKIVKKYTTYQQSLQSFFKKGLKLSQKFQQKLNELEKSTAKVVVKGVMDNLREQFTDEKIINYFNAVEENILENIQVFKGVKTQGELNEEGFVIDYFKEYEVNIILDNTETQNCPVIIETSPSYLNLFGTIEKVNDGRGGWYSDFTKIKAGSILRANGGYLVLNVNHLFEEPNVWQTLKRVLTYRTLQIREENKLFQIPTSILQPEPIDINTKIILIGTSYTYSVLANYEDDFKKMFKIKADFDYEIKRTDEVLLEYAKVVKRLIKEEGLHEFDKSAIAKLIEKSARYVGQQDKLTTRFSYIADLAREANFWASDDGFNVVTAAHIEKAYIFAKERHGLSESKITDMINENVILIDTDSEKVGQINGLAVYGSDFYSFGKPTRITASVSIGNGNIINVDREAGMAGKTYKKGVLIISGYFKETFGQNFPLSFNANFVFEQSYGGVDGDSASCAEIFALLSTLSGLPIKQSIAVTGSLNQKGDVQPIGGANEKIEGFFDLCKHRGLTKKQGVIIPIQNVKDLMLKEEVVEALQNKEFHIYAIERIEEGIEILTGVKAGKLNSRGNYESNTVFGLVEKKLMDFHQRTKPKPVKHKRKSTTTIKKKK
ncbi:MAG TPA: ATP-binding protein [Ignavibacteria bacterium]|nr:ATP-binding protein [Ignavibacteria bacterium]